MVLSKRLAGNVVRLVQFCQVSLNPVNVVEPSAALPITASKLREGKEVRLLQPRIALEKLVAEEVFKAGNEVKLLHPFHELKKLPPDDVSISGKLVRLPQTNHA